METKTFYQIEECLSTIDTRLSSFHPVTEKLESFETAKIRLKQWKERYPKFLYHIVKTTTTYEVIDDLQDADLDSSSK